MMISIFEMFNFKIYYYNIIVLLGLEFLLSYVIVHFTIFD